MPAAAAACVTRRRAASLVCAAPTDPSPRAFPGDRRIGLSWSESTDAGSGLAGYRVVFASNTAPGSCTKGSVLYSGTATWIPHSPLTNGATYGYRVCAFDRAGSLSAGRTVTAEPEPGFHPPTGSVSINAGATLASSARVTLSLSATDPSSVASVCLSNSKTCTHWVAFASSKPWTLASGDGIRSVNVWFRDQWGDASTAPVSDSIVVVTPAAPTMGQVKRASRVHLAPAFGSPAALRRAS